MKKYFLFLFAITAFANPAAPDFSDERQIAVQNTILAKVEGKTISLVDVKKKLDLVFHKNYPHLENSAQARMQFYDSGWRPVLMEMIDQQLILAEAQVKQIPLTDGEVREEMENRFGPNIMITLDKIGVSYDEAWQIVKDEMIVQRMTWWFVHSKAVNQVTPQDIRQAYRIHIKENPSYDELKYRVISVKGDACIENANKMHALLIEKGTTPDLAFAQLQEIDASVLVSAEFCVKDKELSEAHKNALAPLSSGTYSQPILQKTKVGNEVVARIFFLNEKKTHPAPQFEDLASNLRNELIQKAVAQESTAYLEKLRKNHPFYENIPKDFRPFALH